MEYIKSQLSENAAKKILGNYDNAYSFLSIMAQRKKLNIETKLVTRGPNKGNLVLDIIPANIWSVVVENWEYDIALDVIRELFRASDKFKNGIEANSAMEVLIEEWNLLKLGSISWPFSQGDFDGFVQRINSEKCSGLIKDDKVKEAAVKYRRIKEINTVRNDYIETLIFEKNQNILPTLNHRRGIDFFIDGVSYDQKVSKSPTNQFKKDFGDSWKQYAIKNPKVVAEYLYKHQDEGRFGADPRLLVVYLDEDIHIEKIKEAINEVDLEKPIEVNFTFKHKIQGNKCYKVPCFVILLHK